MKQILKWVKLINKKVLMYHRGDKVLTVAEVYPNGVWHTWDQDGMGGENWSCDSEKEAMDQAANSAITQGFI